MAHTPGPWSIGAGGRNIYSPGNLLVAMLVSSQQLNGSEADNAHLIAASPALLENLKRLFALAVMPSNYTEEQRQQILTDARAAIQQAKGE